MWHKGKCVSGFLIALNMRMSCYHWHVRIMHTEHLSLTKDTDGHAYILKTHTFLQEIDKLTFIIQKHSL